MKIRAVKVAHSTNQRWVFKHSPMIEATMHKRKNRILIRPKDKAGIEVVNIIRKNQIVDSKKSNFKTFLSLVA